MEIKASFPVGRSLLKMTQNDGRKVKGWLPKLTFTKPNPVVQVIEDKTKESSLHCARSR